MKASFSVDYQPLPTFSSTTVRFLDRSSSANQWFWDFGDGECAMEENPLHSFEDTLLTYVVFLVARGQDGCTDAVWDTLTIKPAIQSSNEEQENSDWLIFPNPNDGNFFIRRPSGFLGEAQVKIFDSKGKLLVHETSSSAQMNLDLSMFPNGIFHIHILTGERDHYSSLLKN